MATTIKVGQTLPLSISFLDQNGQPMASTPTPDAPPTWADTSAVSNLTQSADGLTANLVGNAAGSDTARVQLMVGGAPFEATIDVTVEAAGQPEQVLTSIAIVAGTPS